MNGKRIRFNIDYNKQAIKNVLNVYTKTTTSGWWPMWIDRWAPRCARWHTVLHHLHHWISVHCLSLAIITGDLTYIQLILRVRVYLCLHKVISQTPVTSTCTHTHNTRGVTCVYLRVCGDVRPDDTLTQQTIQNVAHGHSATHSHTHT